MVLGTADDDMRYGVDIRWLINERLLDDISMQAGFGASAKYNLPMLRAACQPKGIPFYPYVTGWSAPLFADVPGYYEAGAKGVAVFDAETVTDVMLWSWVSRFGHVDETNWRLKNLQFEKAPRMTCEFHLLGDQIRDSQFAPYWGG
jgi:hypothetical protein